jgi:hypothetical protein
LAVEGIVERVHCIAAVNRACFPCNSTTLDQAHKQPTLPHTRSQHTTAASHPIQPAPSRLLVHSLTHPIRPAT